MFRNRYIFLIFLLFLYQKFICTQEIKTDLNSIDILNSEWDKNILMKFNYWGIGCKSEIPINLKFKVVAGKLAGSVTNLYSALYKNIPSLVCVNVHNGLITGNIDEKGRFENVIIKFESDMSYADSDKGAVSIKGNLRKAELVSKRVDWFGKTTFSFLKNS